MMNSAVRGKSARTRSTTSATSAAPPPTRTVIPAGGASGPPGVRRSVTSALPSSRFGAVRRVERERRQVAAGRRGEGRLDVPVARSVRVAVEQRVLGQRQARIDVDEAVDAGDARVRREPARVVVQRGEVGRRRSPAPSVRMARTIGANSPSPNSAWSRSKAARDGTSGGRIEASGALNRTCRNGEPSSSRKREGRDEDRDRVAHDPAGEARPRARPCPASGDDLPDREAVDPWAEDASGSRAAASAPTRPRARPRSRRRSRPSAGS